MRRQKIQKKVPQHINIQFSEWKGFLLLKWYWELTIYSVFNVFIQLKYKMNDWMRHLHCAHTATTYWMSFIFGWFCNSKRKKPVQILSYDKIVKTHMKIYAVFKCWKEEIISISQKREKRIDEKKNSRILFGKAYDSVVVSTLLIYIRNTSFFCGILWIKLCKRVIRNRDASATYNICRKFSCE